MAYAKTETKTASLAGEFGESFARRIFGDEAVDSLPRITRGPRKGKIKGYMGWKKCVVGGWFKTAPGHYQEVNTGFVMRPGPLEYALLSDQYADNKGNEYGFEVVYSKKPNERTLCTAEQKAARAAEFAAEELQREKNAFDDATDEGTAFIREHVGQYNITEENMQDEIFKWLDKRDALRKERFPRQDKA